jgi:hypothetical protein
MRLMYNVPKKEQRTMNSQQFANTLLAAKHVDHIEDIPDILSEVIELLKPIPAQRAANALDIVEVLSESIERMVQLKHARAM